MKRAALCAALILAGAPRMVAAEQWYESYANALKAVEARQWTAAERHLRAAVKSGPRPGRQVRAYGLRFVDFVPGFYLGVVHFNQGRYREAVAELQQVEASGLVARGDPEYARLTDLLEKASARLEARAAPAPSPAATPPPTTPPPTTPSEARRQAETLLAYARDQLQRGNLEAARQALEAARAKDADLVGLTAAAEELARTERERAGRADAEAREKEAARGTLVDRLVDEALALGAAGRHREARAALLRARAAGASDRRLDELRRRLDLAAAAEPANAELSGVRAFYAGRYESAVELLAPLASAGPVSARALFYLACSNAALGLLKGAEGAPLLATAREQLGRARALDQALVDRDRPLISPRVRRLLGAQR